ncbi:hypothetical protein H0H92_009782 [Tricholoma furcatifolium]|nr:hypothetical protein H0H92_009782 [Tricholoma furcatifolium]
MRVWIYLRCREPVLTHTSKVIRWSRLNLNRSMSQSPWTRETLTGIGRVFIGCFAETLAFHSGVVIISYVILRAISCIQAWRYQGSVPPSSDIKREFRFSLIPLTLFYSSLTKLFLLFLLTIWRPTLPSITTSHSAEAWGGEYLFNNTIVNAFKVFEDDQIDREWIIRNVLGGLSTGFGLRVVLDIEPIFTSVIILAGWRAKASVTVIMSSWVGSDEISGEAWKAYSIP